MLAHFPPDIGLLETNYTLTLMTLYIKNRLSSRSDNSFFGSFIQISGGKNTWSRGKVWNGISHRTLQSIVVSERTLVPLENFRAAGNRTQSLRTRSVCTTGILQPGCFSNGMNVRTNLRWYKKLCGTIHEQYYSTLIRFLCQLFINWQNCELRNYRYSLSESFVESKGNVLAFRNS